MFYKDKGIISKYHKNKRIPKIIANDEYFAKHETFTEGRQYDLGKDFFTNFNGIYQSVTLPATYQFAGLENVAYSDITHDSKNVYLSIMTTTGSSDVLYSCSVKQNSHNVLNSLWISMNSENIYHGIFCINSFNVFFSKNIHNSNNIWFSSNCIWCSECIGCNGLENISNCINNIQYTKDEYAKLKNEYLGKKADFGNLFNQVLSSETKNYQSIDSDGKYLLHCNQTTHSLFWNNINVGNNNILVASNNQVSASFDGFLWWSGDTHDIYAQIGSWLCNNIYCTIQGWTCSNIYYSFFLENCSYCLWCIWLKNKQFYILNKQYTKEERFELANKIFEDMDKDWILWNFFPASMNPFYFNDTAAYLIDDTFTKEEVTKEWYLRRDEEIKVDVPSAEVIATSDVNNYQWFSSEWIRQINPEILKKVVKDEKGNYYRIVPMELEFLQKHGLPLPEIHWLDRIKLGFKFK